MAEEIEAPPEELVARIAARIEAGDRDELTSVIAELTVMDKCLVVSRLDEKARSQLLLLLDPGVAADLLAEIASPETKDLLDRIEPETAAGIVATLPAAAQADILGEAGQKQAEAILEAMEPGTRETAREILTYSTDSAGGLMEAEFLAFPKRMTIQDLLQHLRQHRDTYADYEVQYVYVTTLDDGVLRGVLRLRDIVLADGSSNLGTIMIPDPVSVRVDTRLEELSSFFDRHGYLGVPVVDESGRLRGMLRKSAIGAAAENRAKDTFLKISGIIGGDELRTLPLHVRSIRRLSWLAPNIGLNLLAAAVISANLGTIEAVTALAIFLPIVSDMSGCSGNQAVAVTMRELTLGLLKPKEFARVFAKEFALGLINGIVLGVLLGVIAGIWQGSFWLGLVIGGALALNTLISVVLGGLIPMVLRKLKIDPALASNPILTTATDMSGFFIVLTSAALLLSRLTAG